MCHQRRAAEGRGRRGRQAAPAAVPERHGCNQLLAPAAAHPPVICEPGSRRNTRGQLQQREQNQACRLCSHAALTPRWCCTKGHTRPAGAAPALGCHAISRVVCASRQRHQSAANGWRSRGGTAGHGHHFLRVRTPRGAWCMLACVRGLSILRPAAPCTPGLLPVAHLPGYPVRQSSGQTRLPGSAGPAGRKCTHHTPWRRASGHMHTMLPSGKTSQLWAPLLVRVGGSPSQHRCSGAPHACPAGAGSQAVRAAGSQAVRAGATCDRGAVLRLAPAHTLHQPEHAGSVIRATGTR